MCGIAGYILNEGPATSRRVQLMCQEIRHRGPDDEGLHVDGPSAIGARRLSIIDLANWHQPLSNENGSLWIAFNGEIYNFPTLREELNARGHRFKTFTDTEVVLHLYEEHGIEGLAKLRGMFAIAIWDSVRRELLLCRDRFGKKPLYYTQTREGLFFGSELRCLRAANIPLEIDQESLKLYFQFTFIPDPWTPYLNVFKLPAGAWLRYDAKNGIQMGTYAQIPVPTREIQPERTQSETCERLRELFDESVRIRMLADVPLGAFLSGGFDSSSVVASMALQSSEPVRTFSIGFKESAFNELPFAAEVAKRYRTDHHEIVVEPDSVALASRLASHFGEPFGDSSAIPTYIVSEWAARYVKVALSGDGGDEIFGGYTRLADVKHLRKFDRIPQFVRKAVSRLADRLPYSALGKNYLRMMSRTTPMERYLERNYVSYYLRRECLNSNWMLPAESGFLMRKLDRYLLPAGTDDLTQAMHFESSANLVGDLLVKVDRMSMANSLEVRCPLLDQELAEFAATIPNEWKVTPQGGKRILVRALADRLPVSVFERPKMGFGVPLDDWLRGPLRSLVQDTLFSSRSLSRGIVAAPFLEKLIDEHQSRRRENGPFIWSLLMLEMWFEEFESPICQPDFGILI
jgi:asparagine synthase (glutamine-hydrolysing)